MTDLAHRRELEGQICADVLRCHIASDARIRETSEQPARLSGQMASHHLPSRWEEADVRGKRASRGGAGGEGVGGGDVWTHQTAQEGSSTSSTSAVSGPAASYSSKCLHMFHTPQSLFVLLRDLKKKKNLALKIILL